MKTAEMSNERVIELAFANVMISNPPAIPMNIIRGLNLQQTQNAISLYITMMDSYRREVADVDTLRGRVPTSPQYIVRERHHALAGRINGESYLGVNLKSFVGILNCVKIAEDNREQFMATNAHILANYEVHPLADELTYIMETNERELSELDRQLAMLEIHLAKLTNSDNINNGLRGIMLIPQP